ncbi:hypothetical protein BJX63DRAFT_177960 [Aspergillus granulosus]|uniref:Uncharacterized protein n=1 Tax=Aspergillus granulosus TaxID=176169 RepID=A0ABR4I2L8_9EURO
MSDTQTPGTGSIAPPSSPAPSPLSYTLSPLIRVAAAAGKCDVCDGKNRNHNMHRCSRCSWQTCHGQCTPDQGCSYQYTGHECVHECPKEHHLRLDPGDRAQHRQRNPPARNRAEYSSPHTTPRVATDTIAANRGRHRHNNGYGRTLDAARRLYAYVWEVVINEKPELYGGDTEKRALEDYKKKFSPTEDEHHEDISGETECEVDDDGDDYEEDNYVDNNAC